MSHPRYTLVRSLSGVETLFAIAFNAGRDMAAVGIYERTGDVRIALVLSIESIDHLVPPCIALAALSSSLYVLSSSAGSSFSPRPFLVHPSSCPCSVQSRIAREIGLIRA